MEMLEAYAKSTRKRIKKCLKWSRRGATAAGHPAGARTSGATNQKKTRERQKPGGSTAAGHPADPRTSGTPRRSRHPAPARKSGARYPESRRIGHSSPDIRPASPDIRHLAKARTSGPTPGHPASPACVQRIWAEAHVPLRPLDYIYSPTSS